MKKIGIMLSAAAALMMAGCAKDMTETTEVGAVGTLYATVEGSDNTTRVGFDKSGKFYWSEGDQIGVARGGLTELDFTALKINSGVGTGNASFSGDDVPTEGYAVYPYSADHHMSAFGDLIFYSFPSEYNYTKVDTDFFSAEQGSGNSFNAPMWGKIEGNSVHFKHLGGVFCVKIDKMPSASGTFTFSADQNIYGTYHIDLSGSENPAFTVDAALSAGTTGKSVTITFDGATVGESGVFYIPVPTGDYTNVTVSVSDQDGGNKISIPCGNFHIDRAMLKALYPKVAAGGSTTVDSAGDVATTISSTSPAVTVSGWVGNAVIGIPSVSVPVSVSFEQIPTALNFTDIASGGTSSASELVVAIPYDETAEAAGSLPTPDVAIKMPNTTVTLAATAGKAVYGTVTATTADNTLIIDSGVSVDNVVVKKGNIRVKSGATLNNLDASHVVEVYLYAEAGAKLPETLAENVTLVDTSLDDLKEAAANGGEYVLKSDMAFTEPLVVKGDMTLDLNGHSITAEGETLNKVLNTNDALVLVRRGAKLTINDRSNGKGSIDTGEKPSIYAAVKLTDTNDGTSGDVATLVVNGGVLKGYYYGISGNGTRHNTAITVNGGTIESLHGSGIYHPQEGTLAVSDGTITGLTSGIELRSGSLNVSGGEIVSTATEFKSDANNSGTTITGAAVAVSQHTTNKDISVSITGGTMRGIYAFYEVDLQDKNVSNIVVAPSNNAVFDGMVYSQNCSQFISGGTFSDPSALGYLAEGANVKVELNNNYEGPGVGIYYNGNGSKANVEIDLKGYKWTVTDDPLHGSPNTVSQYFHLEKDATFTVKNGTIEPVNSESGKMLFQNYCNLTLQNVTLKAGSACSYVMSNNNGSCNIIDSTVTAAEGNCAFDVYSFDSYEGVTVTVSGNSVITGRVEFDGNNNRKNIKLVVDGGTFNGDLVVNEAYYDAENPNIILNGGTFNGTGWSDYQE